MHPNAEKRLRRFERHLREAELSETAVVHYVGVVRRGLAAGDLIAPLRGASSQGGVKIAWAAILRWARWTGDAALDRRLRSIAKPPRSKAKPPALDAERRRKIAARIEAVEDAVRRGFLLLVVWSGLRVGEILEASRADVLEWRAARPGAARGAEMLLARRDWKTVRDLLATTVSDRFRPGPRPSSTYVAAYAVLRRLLRRACKDAGVPYAPPEEFRRLVLSELRSGSMRRQETKKC